MLFGACQELKNPWNDNKPVKISRDGQVNAQCISVQQGMIHVIVIPCLPEIYREYTKQ